MKYFAFLILVLIPYSSLFAQEIYNVNGESLELKSEADGKIDFLYMIEGRGFRYFLKTENDPFIELKTEDFKKVLANLTSDTNLSPDQVKFTRVSIKKYIDAYNKKADATYIETDTKRVEFRLMPFVGITNNPFITNEDNLLFGQFGGELELRETKTSPRSALFVRARHVLSNEDLDYSTTEIALGYRYRFVKKEKFNLYADVKFATLNFSNATILVPAESEDGMAQLRTFKDTSFDVPFIFGVGADYKVAKDGFITLTFNEIFAANLDNQGNFSTNFALGYRFGI